MLEGMVWSGKEWLHIDRVSDVLCNALERDERSKICKSGMRLLMREGGEYFGGKNMFYHEVSNENGEPLEVVNIKVTKFKVGSGHPIIHCCKNPRRVTKNYRISITMGHNFKGVDIGFLSNERMVSESIIMLERAELNLERWVSKMSDIGFHFYKK